MNYSDYIVDKYIFKKFDIGEEGFPFKKLILSKEKTIEYNIETTIGEVFFPISGTVRFSLDGRFSGSPGVKRNFTIKIYENDTILAEKSEEFTANSTGTIYIYTNIKGVRKYKIKVSTAASTATISNVNVSGKIIDNIDEYVVLSEEGE